MTCEKGNHINKLYVFPTILSNLPNILGCFFPDCQVGLLVDLSEPEQRPKLFSYYSQEDEDKENSQPLTGLHILNFYLYVWFLAWCSSGIAN